MSHNPCMGLTTRLACMGTLDSAHARGDSPHSCEGECHHCNRLNARLNAATDNAHLYMRSDLLLILCTAVDMLEEPVSEDEETDAAPKAGKGKKKRRRSQ